ncbi:uncharacterized protein PFLUO_LOCUS3631 [Penicillium psychrofluorescens]|uniref:uncharacterized protein n=1 Tax=Penicillium psychrofluorescens TaxID=3158075 RepID=UPI003CCC99F0
MQLALQDPKLWHEKSYLNGQWKESQSGETFDVINPSTGDILTKLPELTKNDVSIVSEQAVEAFNKWKRISPKLRGSIIRKWAQLMLDNAEDLGRILTAENGKPFAEAKGEIAFAASYLEFYSGEAERTYGDIIPSANTANRVFAIHQPIGVVACLTPWNFPAAMVTRKAGAALAAGCAAIVKPAGETSLTALALAHLGEQAGLPPGVFNVVTGLKNVAEIGKALCEDHNITKLSFTGSTAVGKLLMRQCADSLKKLSMELGGNSPFIVFDDCDLQTTLNALMGAKVRNSGQTCVCANRIYVQRGVYSELSNLLVDKFSQAKCGDGFDDGVMIGPLTVERGVEKVQAHVDDALSKGAKILHGGKRMERKGNFFQPSVIANMNDRMLSHNEEIFGPVAALYPFDTEEEVLKMANNSPVGLGSYVCTNNVARVWRMAEGLEVGIVGVNTGVIAGGEIPFGGIKHSGFGVEGGKWGLSEFMVTKSIIMAVPTL